jgi:ABC-type antimicrobial peptide transport system permease subunit
VPNSQPKPPAADIYEEVTRRIRQLPGVDGVAGGTFVPWRDAGSWRPIQFRVDGYTPEDGEDDPYARDRHVGPGFFAAVGVPVIAGREFTDEDRRSGERTVIVSQSVAQRLFPNGDILNRTFRVTGALTASQRYINSEPSRIVGVVADVDDENVVRAPAMTVYSPMGKGMPMRLFVRTSGDPHALEQSVTRIIREVSPNQAILNPATLEEVRAQILTPERLNAFVVSGFAGIALLIAVVGVAGVLAFSVSARTREFGVRLAIGSSPRDLLVGILLEGARIVAIGVAAGGVAGYLFARVAASYLENLHLAGALPVVGAAAVLIGTAMLASLMPAARASRVDVLKALRSE